MTGDPSGAVRRAVEHDEHDVDSDHGKSTRGRFRCRLSGKPLGPAAARLGIWIHIADIAAFLTNDASIAQEYRRDLWRRPIWGVPIEHERIEAADCRKRKAWRMSFKQPAAGDKSKGTVCIFFTLAGDLIAATYMG